MRKVLLVDQLQSHRRSAASGHVRVAVPRQPLVAQQRRLVEGEFQPNGIGRDDDGEECGRSAGAAGHEIAGRHAPVADAAGDGSPELGEFEVELGLPHHRLVRCDRGLGIAGRLRTLLENLLADRPVTQQLLAARQIGLGEHHIGLRQLEIRPRLIEGVLERTFVDGEKEIPLLHDLAVLELHLVEVARHARAHLNRIDRDEPADIFVPVDDGARDGLGHRYRRRWRRGLFLGLAAAHKEQRQADQSDRSEGAGGGHTVAR